MMKFVELIVSSIVTTGFLASNSHAVILSFDAAGSLFDSTFATYQGAGDTYTQAGYSITVGAGQHFDSMDSNGLYWHNGSANDNYDSWATLTFSGGSFDLNSFQLNLTGGELRTNLNPTPVSYALGNHSVNLSNLTWVQFSPIGNGTSDANAIYLDNVNVSAVPEPSVTLLGGLAGTGLLLRRRRR